MWGITTGRLGHWAERASTRPLVGGAKLLDINTSGGGGAENWAERTPPSRGVGTDNGWEEEGGEERGSGAGGLCKEQEPRWNSILSVEARQAALQNPCWQLSQ